MNTKDLNKYCHFAVIINTFLFSTEAWSQDCPVTSPGMTASIISEETLECAVEDIKTFESFKVIKETSEIISAIDFQLDDRIILCIDPPFSGYITVWDAAPNGARELLYPNIISHPNGNTEVAIETGNKFCVGEVGSGYEINVSNNEGTGKGQFYLLVTKMEGMQLTSDDFIVPAYGMSVSIKSENTAVEDMYGYYDTWIEYNVTE